MTEAPTSPCSVVNFSEWEGSKENIQPLKRGRKASELRKAFAPLQTIERNEESEEPPPHRILHDPTIVCFNNHNNKIKLSIEREQWEQKILSLQQQQYHEEDPLKTWMDYLTWIEDNYPSLDKASQFVNVLQRCTREFVNHPRYINDRRYLLLWLRYADTCNDPIDVYTYLHTNAIGVDHADLYISWAQVLEDRKDFRAADSVLERGLNRGAQPLKRLQLCYESFKHRFMENIIKQSRQQQQQLVSAARQQQNGFDFSENGAQNFQRVAFNLLSHTQSISTTQRPTAMQMPTSITPMRSNMSRASASGFARTRTTKLSASSSRTKKSSTNNNFQVFDETYPQPTSITPTSKKRRTVPYSGSSQIDFGQLSSRILPFDLPIDQQQQQAWNYLPSERESEKENHDLPTQWTNYRVPQRECDPFVQSSYSVTVPLVQQQQQQQQGLSFTIFEDDNNDQEYAH
jgi:hypothetical protein